MADNRIYVVCRWCERQCSPHVMFTLARFVWGEDDLWHTNQNHESFSAFLDAHNHKEEPEWWSDKYVMCPFRFEYEDRTSNELLSGPSKGKNILDSPTSGGAL